MDLSDGNCSICRQCAECKTCACEQSESFTTELSFLNVVCPQCEIEMTYKQYSQGHQCLIKCEKCDQDYNSADVHDCIDALKHKLASLQKGYWETYILPMGDGLANGVKKAWERLGLSEIPVSAKIAVKIEDENGNIYIGSLSQKQYEGYGVLYEKAKNKVYEGEFRNGVKEGKGRTYTIGEDNMGHCYQGRFKDGKYQDEEGVYRWPEGERYIGAFNENSQEGIGLYRYSTPGDIYLGTYHDGLKHGLGLHSKQGDTYLGDFQGDTSQGWGLYRLSLLGETYMGQWRGGAFHGMGAYEQADGQVYVGSFENDVRHGSGVVIGQGGFRAVKMVNGGIVHEKVIQF
ncbi:hypothetical protein FGO68_gene3718 [Halteria grandinella]|uniref:Uncharacterized protein n=1 Tax=Halteria grandinella TaxID=5974 RepID=A0A8J8T2N5_HALGN|nr:hypothetical protein FGO68_gene3718 [Halteria grandinella]